MSMMYEQKMSTIYEEWMIAIHKSNTRLIDGCDAWMIGK